MPGCIISLAEQHLELTKIMPPTMNFQDWLHDVEPEDHEEVYSIYRAVKDGRSFGIFDVKSTRGGVGLILKAAHRDQGLLIATDKAKSAFLAQFVSANCGNMDMESWYGYRQAMAKDD